MRVIVGAVGRMKQGPERELAERYCKRAAQSGRGIGLKAVEIIEIRESRAQELERRLIEESIALATIIPDRAAIAILDERGDASTARRLPPPCASGARRDRPAACFIVGGADGLAPSLRDRASLRLSFGAATWPHQLVRIMLLEQIYRAITILAGHPYHHA